MRTGRIAAVVLGATLLGAVALTPACAPADAQRAGDQLARVQDVLGQVNDRIDRSQQALEDLKQRLGDLPEGSPLADTVRSSIERVQKLLDDTEAQRRGLEGLAGQIGASVREDGTIDWQAAGSAVAAAAPLAGPLSPWVAVAGAIVGALGGIFGGRKSVEKETRPLIDGAISVIRSVDSALSNLSDETQDTIKKDLASAQSVDGKRLVAIAKGKGTHRLV